MTDEQGMLDLVGGAPSEARPDERSTRVTAAAARAMTPSVLAYFGEEEVSLDDFFSDLVRASSCGEDVVNTAKSMSDSAGYALSDEFVELVSEWDGRLARARDEEVEAWVARARPVPPFEGVARVRVAGRSPVVGFAYRDGRHDRSATCVVVTDDAPRPVDGGRLVAWEDLLDVAAPTEADEAANEARLESDRAWDRRRARREAAEADGRARAAVLAAERTALEALETQDVRLRASAAMRAAADALDGRGDLDGPAWTTALAAADALARRAGGHAR